jgi:hypothetical protein
VYVFNYVSVNISRGFQSLLSSDKADTVDMLREAAKFRVGDTLIWLDWARVTILVLVDV